MTSHKKSLLRIRLTREIAGTQIEVLFDDEQQLGKAYALLAQLCERVTVEELRITLSRLWIRNGSSSVISEKVSESTHRVALSLFQSWPNPKGVGENQAESGLSQGYVSRILAGRQGDVGHWFTRQGNLWNLSPIGVNAMNKEVAPALFDWSEEGDSR